MSKEQSNQQRVEQSISRMEQKSKRDSSLKYIEEAAKSTAKNMVECLDSPFLRMEWPEKPELWIKNAIMDAVTKHDMVLTRDHDWFLRKQQLPIPKYKVGQKIKFDRSKYDNIWIGEGVQEATIYNIEIMIGDPRDTGPVSYWCEEVDDWVPEQAVWEAVSGSEE